MVSDGEDFADLLHDDKDCHALSTVDFDDLLEHIGEDVRGEAEVGFVEHEELRFRNQGAGNSDHDYNQSKRC